MLLLSYRHIYVVATVDGRDETREMEIRQRGETEEEVEVKKLPACALCYARSLVCDEETIV